MKHKKAIRNTGGPDGRGDGLTALLKLKEIMRHEAGPIGSRTSSDLQRRTCNSMTELEGFVEDLENDLTILEA